VLVDTDLSDVFREFETPSAEPWAAHGVRSRVVKYSETLGHIVRVGTLEQQKVSTYRLIRDAIVDHRVADAVALVEVFEHEADVVYTHFQHDIPATREFLRVRGYTEQAVAVVDETVLAQLRHPDGRSHVSNRMWQEFRSSLKTLVRLVGSGDVETSLMQTDCAKELWRRLHDRDCDHLSGLLSEVARAWGDTAIRDIWMSLNQWGFAFRYSRYDVSRQPWAECLGALLYITFESGRGHLMGPERTGDVEFFEERDRWVWAWDPCGSCGRLVRGDTLENTPPRMEPPYNWPALAGPYDWAWGKRGMSPYSVHSCIKLAQIPIDQFGYPIRVVDCPTYPDHRDDKCYRYVYKDPALVPDEAYAKVGRTRPTHFGSRQNNPGSLG
jgi:hypothetical protein